VGDNAHIGTDWYNRVVDTMKVIQNLVPTSKYNIKCTYPMVAEFVVVHNTANDASAANEVAYMIRNNDKVAFHYAIDDKEIVQGIPENRNAWHAGDGSNGPGNRKGLSIEICYSKSGGKRFEEAEKLAAKFIAFKLKEKGWGINRVKKHQDFSSKYCPHRTLDMGWQRFLDMVQSELNALKGVDKVAEQNTPSSWAKEAWEWAKKEKLLDGTRPKDNLTREEFAVVLKRVVDGK
jgi:N-acetylmuramoyl-L-alanine amidase